MSAPLIIRHIEGLQDYQTTWQAMQDFTRQRTAETPDELWLLEHHPVFTQGRAGKSEHLLNPGNIPVVHSDRGGQITYHGPGQLIGYCLLDLKRKELGVRDLVGGIEQTLIEYLASLGIQAEADPKAPGVYVEGKKIAALGLRIHKSRSYHGFSINVNMDLSPFMQINPCGYQGLTITQIVDFGISKTPRQAACELLSHFQKQFGYPRN